MKSLIVGLGNQGNKRANIIGLQNVISVDPFNKDADFKSIYDVPLNDFDDAFLCVPDDQKIELISYLLNNKKPLLVEKPIISSNIEELIKLKNLSEEKQTSCYTAYNHRFEPHLEKVKSIIDSKKLGKIYSLKLFYGNGTAKDVFNSPWRDKGDGVLPDLGSHLLDMVDFFFEDQSFQYEKVAFNNFENKSYDHIIFQSKNNIHLTLEASLLSWRNTFRLDLFAEKGSLHIDCLCKWGPSKFTKRMRTLPSGRPTEENEILEQKDPTWKKEFHYFKDYQKLKNHTLDKDIYYNKILNNL